MSLDKDNVGIIDINEQHQIAILAGILGITIQQVYEGRKTGKLPPVSTATYKECIQFYINFYKNKIAAKSGTMLEAKMEQDIRLSKAREAAQWLEIKKQKEEVVSVSEMTELFVPVFHIIKSNLVNLTREHPETTTAIDRTLERLYVLGEKMVARAKADGLGYVQAQLDKEVILPEVDEDLKTSFGIHDNE